MRASPDLEVRASKHQGVAEIKLRLASKDREEPHARFPEAVKAKAVFREVGFPRQARDQTYQIALG